MFTKRTVIGIAVGSIIAAIGVYALASDIGLQVIKISDTIDVGKSATYGFVAPQGSQQYFTVTGERFHVSLQTPADGIQKDEDFRNEITFEWYVLQEGMNRIVVQNTGSGQVQVEGTFSKNTDAILFAYHIMVITAGVVIIGFSAAFSVRRPKGF